MPSRRPVRRSGSRLSAPPVKARFSFRAMISGLVFSLLFAVVAFIGWSLIFSVTSLPDKYMTYVAYGTSFVAVLLGGLRATRQAGGAGLLNGGGVGLAYSLLLGAVATLLTSSPFSLGLSGLTRPAFDILAGIVGGVLGAGSR